MDIRKMTFEEVKEAIEEMFVEKLGKVTSFERFSDTDEHYSVNRRYGATSIEWEVKAVDDVLMFIQVETLQDPDEENRNNRAVKIEGILKELGIKVSSSIVKGFLTYVGSTLAKYKSKAEVRREKMGKFKDLLKFKEV